ncbi:WGR domain-containing protein [Roseibium sp. SCP14]|uniref:WGR domain-containing protein n=1 Tax=Roseibium sp. SCP14 TaxID=3141375 RepID=UPI003A974B30
MPNSQAPLLLLRIDPNKNMRRFYAMTVQPNLFGGSSLIRTWGRIGNSGQLKVELFEDKATALRARDRLALTKQRRGYITQAEGNEGSVN